MSLIIEKVEGGFVITHHDTKTVATAEHVANFIVKFWPDVTAHIRTLIAPSETPEEPVHGGQIVNR
jgi:hypothetical protein